MTTFQGCSNPGASSPSRAVPQPSKASLGSIAAVVDATAGDIKALCGNQADHCRPELHVCWRFRECC
jgi:hypothetical protein